MHIALLFSMARSPSDCSLELKGSTEGKELEIKGLLGAIGWGLDDRVTRVALFTADEDIYEIEIAPENSDLAKLLRKVVIVRGELVQNERGMKSIYVRHFCVVE